MKFIPHDYQKYCIARMIASDKLGLFLDMGLGKTVITLTAIQDLKYNRFLVRKVLVIAPKKVAEDTWTREAEKWDHLKLLRVLPVLGPEQKRIRALCTPADVYVINRENVVWITNYYGDKWPFDMVVIDELSSFKSSQAKRFKAMRIVRPRIQRIVGLTGTPSPNGLMDLWAQVYLLDRGERLEKYITHYRERYFYPSSRNGNQVFAYSPKDGAEEAIREKISDICISLRADDYLSLPERIDDVRRVKLDDAAEKRYKLLKKKMLLEVGDKTICAANAAALSNKLLQLCNGAVYDETDGVAEIHNCKLEAFAELIEALNGKPALVFYSFKHDVPRMKAVIGKMKLRVAELKDAKSIADWNAGKVDILLAHPASAAYGLNLQEGGSHVIWFGLNWSLELYQQANARLYRQGQKNTVYIHHLVTAGGVDERVMDVLQNKGATQDALLNALKAEIRSVKNEKQSGHEV